MDIQEKVVIITGASQGIGLASARLFAEAGAKVALAARSADTLHTIVNELHEQHREALAVPTDMCNKDAIEAMVDNVFEQYGRIDILINNAGKRRVAMWLMSISSSFGRFLNSMCLAP